MGLDFHKFTLFFFLPAALLTGRHSERYVQLAWTERTRYLAEIALGGFNIKSPG